MARKRLGKSWGSGVRRTNNTTNAKVHALVWGNTGTGKTRFIGTAPRPFIISTENGLLTLHKQDIPAFDITDEMPIYDTYMAILDSAQAHEKVMDEKGNVLVDFAEVDTIACDSLWRLFQLLKEEMAEKGASGFELWEQMKIKMAKLITRTQSLGYHTIFTCGEAIKADRENTDIKVPVLNLEGGFREEAPYLFDLNLYMNVTVRGRIVKYTTHTRPINKRTAKSRVELPDEIENPDFSKIVTMIQEGLENKIKK